MGRISIQSIKFLIAVVICLVIGFLALGIHASPAHSSPKAARALELLNGMKEGTRRANRLMGVNTRIPWCGAAAAYAVRKAGRKPPKNYLSARAWRKWGKRVSKRNAKYGDILNIKTKRGWHVTVFKYRKGRRFCAIGGNQSNRIKTTCYRISSVRGVRR